MTARVLIDSAVMLYAIGGPHPLREPCQTLLSAAGGQLELHASVELVQEVLFHRMRRVAVVDAVGETRDVVAACVLHYFDAPVMDRMLDLVSTGRIRGRDAVHAATALVAGIDTIITPDSAFDAVVGLGRLDPETAVARLLA